MKILFTKLVQVWFASVFAPSSVASGSPFKLDLDFLKKPIRLIIFLRFYGEKLFFNFGIGKVDFNSS